MTIPKGVYFEERRKRYRVRLYVGPVVVWRSYHKDLPTALKAYWTAKVTQLGTKENPPPPPTESLDLSDLIGMLKT